ncbi:Mfs transporter [Aspergillus sp. HF37]|nr:Mfs transporter [Aspergillus sp. HF37]
MASQPTLFTASRAQTLTYLLAVCPFSIAFLVFMNSTVSFVVTELIGLHGGEGDAVGTLGFADELLALAACPVWGMLSDRIGVRHVCAAGYVIVALALALFVQATNVYPQLLLGRLLFSLGGAAVSTMVTAILPAVTGTKHGGAQTHRGSVASEAIVTPDGRPRREADELVLPTHPPSSRLAGFAGMFAGCGALVSLVVFLPLPERLGKSGLSPAQALQYSYYLVAVVALLVSVWCFIGFRNIPGEEGKGWGSLFLMHPHGMPQTTSHTSNLARSRPQLPYWKQVSVAVALGFRNRNIGLGYLGGLVARASSVGISLFIPLSVNHYYRASGLCDEDPSTEPGVGVGGIKRSCPNAYILASILTGVSQLIALLTAPAFGFLSEKSRRYHLPLLFATLAGVTGYIAFALLPSPQFKGADGTPGVFVVMALIGMSQIGAIVCSLGVLSNGILSVSAGEEEAALKQTRGVGASNHAGSDVGNGSSNEGGETGPTEQQPLLGEEEPRNQQSPQLVHLKGTIAGVYSLFGGAGILVLTKLGGLLFDVLSPSTPFFIMAGFNGLLCVMVVASGLVGIQR